MCIVFFVGDICRSHNFTPGAGLQQSAASGPVGALSLLRILVLDNSGVANGTVSTEEPVLSGVKHALGGGCVERQRPLL